MKRRSALFFSLLILGLVSTAAAQTVPQWNRYPAISPDGSTIVFTYRGNLYLVPTAGGNAMALTSHPAHDYKPVWSNDGRRIAFASDRHGNFDIYVVPATGGEPTRLTFHSADESPFTFEPGDDSILFGAARHRLRAIPTACSPRLMFPPAGSRNGIVRKYRGSPLGCGPRRRRLIERPRAMPSHAGVASPRRCGPQPPRSTPAL